MTYNYISCIVFQIIQICSVSAIGFEYAVESAKSLVISCALAEKQISVEKATSLSRLEVEFQVSITHDFVVYLQYNHIRTFIQGVHELTMAKKKEACRFYRDPLRT